jgi:hypothetical protein
LGVGEWAGGRDRTDSEDRDRSSGADNSSPPATSAERRNEHDDGFGLDDLIDIGSKILGFL